MEQEKPLGQRENPAHLQIALCDIQINVKYY